MIGQQPARGNAIDGWEVGPEDLQVRGGRGTPDDAQKLWTALDWGGEAPWSIAVWGDAWSLSKDGVLDLNGRRSAQIYAFTEAIDLELRLEAGEASWRLLAEPEPGVALPDAAGADFWNSDAAPPLRKLWTPGPSLTLLWGRPAPGGDIEEARVAAAMDQLRASLIALGIRRRARRGSDRYHARRAAILTQTYYAGGRPRFERRLRLDAAATLRWELHQAARHEGGDTNATTG